MVDDSTAGVLFAGGSSALLVKKEPIHVFRDIFRYTVALGIWKME